MRFLLPVKIFIAAISVFTFCAAMLPAVSFAQVTLSGSGITGNPKMFFKGLSGGDPKLTAKVRNTLWATSWFDLVPSAKGAEYIIDGRADGGTILLSVKNGAGIEMFRVTGQGTNSDEAVYAAVDMILNKLFGIEGICRTKIAFSAEKGRCKSKGFHQNQP